MRESRIAEIAALAAAIFIILGCAGQLSAQRFSMEFKAGATATSTVNSLASNKAITDVKIGPTLGASFGLNIMDGMLRAVGECYYTSKGESYWHNDVLEFGKFESDLFYFELCPNIRYYTPYLPIYVGAGIYMAWTTAKNVSCGDTLDNRHHYYIHYKPDFYRTMDLGPRVAIGTEIGVSSIRVILEAAYEYGLTDISNRPARQIHNQSVTATLGLCFQIPGRHFRRY